MTTAVTVLLSGSPSERPLRSTLPRSQIVKTSSIGKAATGFFVDYDYLVTGETARIRESGAASGIGVLASFGHDDLGRRTGLAYGNGTSASYQYQGAPWLKQLKHDLAGPSETHDLTLDFAHNAAGQIVGTTRSNDLYASPGQALGTTATLADGLNRIASWDGAIGYDPKGNIAGIGTSSFGYTADNPLTSKAGAGFLLYDGLGRLKNHNDLATGAETSIVYDGLQAIAEYAGPSVVRRFVHGPGVDD